MKNLRNALNLSSAKLREVRVANFCKNLKADAEFLIQEQRRRIRNLQDELDTLLDLGEDTRLSIANRLRGMDTKELIDKTFKLSFEIKEQTRNLASMEEDFEILFGSTDDTVSVAEEEEDNF